MGGFLWGGGFWGLVGSCGFFWVLVGSFGFLWVLVGAGGEGGEALEKNPHQNPSLTPALKKRVAQSLD